MSLKNVWLNSRSEQLLVEIKEGLTKSQKESLEKLYQDADMQSRGGSKYKKYILSQALEIGLLALKRDYEIEQSLTGEQPPQKKVLKTPKHKKDLPMDEIIKDYLSGMGFVQLGAKYKVAHSTIHRRIKLSGVKRNK